jgi:hypothetical protein
MPVSYDAFESKYGFRSPNFTVDAEGNIVASSITLGTGGGEGVVDFTVSEGIDNTYRFGEVAGPNPTLTLSRTRRYLIHLDVPVLKFYIYESDLETLYNDGLAHSTEGTAEEAQGQTGGVLGFTVPIDAPDLLYYGNQIGTIYGIINIVDPAGKFGTVEITTADESTSTTTGALTVAGGVGIEKNLNVGGTVTATGLNFNGIGVPALSSSTNLELDAANRIIFKIGDFPIGFIDEDALNITIQNSNIASSNITSSTINSSSIGLTTPAAAAFTNLTANSSILNTVAMTTATITGTPTTNTSVVNKVYVDTTTTALAIAFGL